MERAELRVVRFLAGGPAVLSPSGGPDKWLLDGGERGTIAADAEPLAMLYASGSVVRDKDTIRLLETGNPSLPSRPAENAHANQHRDLEAAVVELDDGRAHVVRNCSESPLGNLVRRKSKAGAPFLSTAEYEAGERLRADYTRGQIMPRLGANWVASVSSGRRGGPGGAAELTEAALAARQRVDRAVDAVGPELSGLLIDVCCFLKGLELVERERGWPVRSAKIVLKTALAALARHYRPKAEARRPAHALHWGAQDYRPSLR